MRVTAHSSDHQPGQEGAEESHEPEEKQHWEELGTGRVALV